mgnify:CR=1 FL=1
MTPNPQVLKLELKELNLGVEVEDEVLEGALIEVLDALDEIL